MLTSHTSSDSAVAGLKLLGGPNLHFYCSTLVFNIYFLEFAKLLGGPGPPRPLPTLRHCLKKKRFLSQSIRDNNEGPQLLEDTDDWHAC